jgi:predicted nucleic acid-binding protein
VIARATLSARDSIRVAVMERRRISRVLSFDSGFDGIPGLTRLA